MVVALALELQTPRRGVAQGASRRGEPGDHSPQAPSPGFSLEKAATPPARERPRAAKGAKARETPRRRANGGKSGLVLFQHETRLETNPKVGFCWMRKGKHKPLPTPGTNRKAWISGALNFYTGRLHWVSGGRKNDELFMKLLQELRRTYRSHKQLHLAKDNDSSHASKRVEKYLEDSGGRVRLHPLPSWSPESNPVELVWCSLHEAVSRNHQCAGLDDLMEFAEGYLKERQPFMLKLGAIYDQLERSPP
jgi:transposase